MLFKETTRQMKEVAWWGRLNVDGWRSATSGGLRYSADDVLLLTSDNKAIAEKHRLC